VRVVGRGYVDAVRNLEVTFRSLGGGSKEIKQRRLPAWKLLCAMEDNHVNRLFLNKKDTFSCRNLSDICFCADTVASQSRRPSGELRSLPLTTALCIRITIPPPSASLVDSACLIASNRRLGCILLFGINCQPISCARWALIRRNYSELYARYDASQFSHKSSGDSTSDKTSQCFIWLIITN